MVTLDLESAAGCDSRVVNAVAGSSGVIVSDDIEGIIRGNDDISVISARAGIAIAVSQYFDLFLTANLRYIVAVQENLADRSRGISGIVEQLVGGILGIESYIDKGSRGNIIENDFIAPGVALVGRGKGAAVIGADD